jgi:hypothetical protein
VAEPTPPPGKIRHVDLPDLGETFADSIHGFAWDGQTLRVEFCVTRYPEGKPGGDAAPATRYPACRMVLTGPAAADLHNRLQKVMTALAKTGVVKPAAPPKGTA